MKSLRLVGPRKFQWFEEEKPEPGAGEVRIAVQAVGICGSDIHAYVHCRTGDHVMVEPMVLGHEFSGLIDAIGPGVEGLAVGDLVAVDPAIACGHCEYCLEGNPNFCVNLRFAGSVSNDGALREYLIQPATMVYRLGKAFTSSDAAMLEPLGVALHSIRLAKVKPADWVAIHGCGPIGLCLIQMARLSGAGKIIAFEPLENRRQMALKMGADHVFSPADGEAAQCIRSLGRSYVDIALEAAGDAQAVWEAVEIAKPGGEVVLVGIPKEDQTAFRASAARQKGLTIKIVRRMKHTYPQCIALVEKGLVDLRSFVTHHLPFEQAGDGYRMVEERSQGVIKAVIHIGEEV